MNTTDRAARAIAKLDQWRETQDAKSERPQRIVADEAKVIEALRTRDDLRGMVTFDEFGQRIIIAEPPPWKPLLVGGTWTDTATTGLMAYLQAQRYVIRGRGMVEAAVAMVARDRPIHPVRTFLDGCRAVWDGTPRLHMLFEAHFGAEGDERYLAAVWRAFLISAVARIYAPGCKVDTVPVLEAVQGAGKSRSLRVLADPWITESLPPLSDSKEAALALRGVWFAELAELAAMSRAEVEHVKAFLSRQVDDIREPYARHSTRTPRQCVMVGTTNAATYLRDHTGNRRFWPVRCGVIDLDALARDRMQLFGEAVHAYEAGEPWHLIGDVQRTAAQEQERRRYVPELEVECVAFLDRMLSQGHRELEMRLVIAEVGRIDTRENPREAGAVGSQLAGIMSRHGWRSADRIGRGERRRNLWGYVGDKA